LRTNGAKQVANIAAAPAYFFRSIMTLPRSFRLVPLSVVVGACYTYAPVERSAAIPQGTSVRARVTPTASQRIAPLIGVNAPRVLDGSLVERNGDTMILEVPTTTSTTPGSTVQTLNQRISLAPADVTEIETRTLDRTKTSLVVAAVAAGAAVLVAKYLHDDPGVDRPPTGSPPENRIPLIRFRF
jgi:hypothetical protein